MGLVVGWVWEGFGVCFGFFFLIDFWFLVHYFIAMKVLSASRWAEEASLCEVSVVAQVRSPLSTSAVGLQGPKENVSPS